MSFNAPAVAAPPPPTIPRNVLIAAGVIVFHVLALWALQSGLLRRAVEVVVPAEILVAIMAQPAPSTQQPLPQPQPKVQVKSTAPTLATPAPPVAQKPSPTPLTVALSTAVPEAKSPPTPSPTSESTPSTANTSASKVPSAKPATKAIDRSCVEADAIYNPKPLYPKRSNQLGEVGTAVLRIHVGADGLPKEIDLKESSGFYRLDFAAMAGVKTWRFMPCKIDGVPTETTFIQPIPFQLSN